MIVNIFRFVGGWMIVNLDTERRGNDVKMFKEKGKRRETCVGNSVWKHMWWTFKKKCYQGHLNYAILLGNRIERVLDVALSYNAEMPNDLHIVATVKSEQIHVNSSCLSALFFFFYSLKNFASFLKAAFELQSKFHHIHEYTSLKRERWIEKYERCVRSACLDGGGAQHEVLAVA